MKEKKVRTYKYEDIFKDIPDDPENVIMNLPDEIIEEMKLKEGDKLKFDVGDKGTIIIRKVSQLDSEEQMVTVIQKDNEIVKEQ